MSFYALSNALLFLLIIPLVIFYFLKLRRPRVGVSSLVLWQQVLQDNRVNSPFQKFKRNLLLLLQLLVLLALVLAAMQPFWVGRDAKLDRLPILIDCSASMAALDKEGGVSRFDAAKTRVRDMIDRMTSEQEYCLISYSRSARKAQGFTNNKKLLRDALDGIEIEDVPSDIEDALRMAQSLARAVSFDTVMILSDGNFPPRADFEMSFNKIDYQKLAPAGTNLGITALNARRAGEENWDVFVQVESSTDGEGSAMLTLTQDETEVGKESITLAKGGSQRLMFRVRGDKPSAVQAILSPDQFDALASDNLAFLELPRSRPVSVFVAPSLISYRHALRSIKGLRVYPDEGKPDASEYDLLITDRAEDLAIEARTAFCIGVVPGDLQKLISVEPKGSAVVDWRRNSPLLQHVELAEVLIADQPQKQETTQDTDFETAGYEIIAHGHRGPLIVEKRDKEKLRYFALFHTDRSTLPYRVGFPILVSNLIGVSMREAGIAEAAAARTGVLPPVPLSPERTYVVEDPRGGKREEKTDVAGQLTGIPASRVGRYIIHDGGVARARVGASLLSASETQLAGVEEIQFNAGLSQKANTIVPKTDKPLWFGLSLLAFCVVLVEWWYYQRRPGGKI